MKLEEVPLGGPGHVSPEESSQSPALKYILDGVAAEYGERVVDVLAEKREATGVEIADEAGVKKKFVRRTLEKLYERRAVSPRRTKDSKTGWISFLWRLEPLQALKRLKEKKRSLLQESKEKLRHEREVGFFACENRCVRVEFDEAMETDFECPECGKELHESDNSDVIRSLEERIEKLERELDLNRNSKDGG